jgi:hypothetical protein
MFFLVFGVLSFRIFARHHFLNQNFKSWNYFTKKTFLFGSLISRQTLTYKTMGQWKRISCKQSARWQHLSRLKDSDFFSLEQKILVVKKHYNLYLRLVTPSGGWWSPMDQHIFAFWLIIESATEKVLQFIRQHSTLN